MQNHKVVLLTADVAGGHLSTASALQQAWNKSNPDDYFEIIDLFEELDIAPFNTSEQSYDLFTRNFTLRAINNQFFRGINTGAGYELWRSYVLGRLYYPTLKLISNSNPDLIIVNHPIVATVVDEVKHKVDNFKYAVCVVDIGTVAKSWASTSADLIVSPASVSTDQLIRHGIASSKIETGLFPLRPSLKDIKPKAGLLKQYGLAQDKPVIAITGGGIGMTAITEVVADLVKETQYQILVACGKQNGMRDSLAKRFSKHENVNFLGFVERMQDLYVLADVVVAKAGPNTVLELLAFNKKAILAKEIGQQEVGNIKYAMQESDQIVELKNGDVAKRVSELLNKKVSTVDPRRSLDKADRIVEKLQVLTFYRD